MFARDFRREQAVEYVIEHGGGIALKWIVLVLRPTTTLILILGFQKWSPPGLAWDCGKKTVCRPGTAAF
jgi:hypothetical protein